MNKPKAIGTAAESAVVKFLHSVGYDKTTALRRTLSGKLDQGDVWAHNTEGSVVFEVKGGEAAKTASHAQIDLWLAEAEVEAENSGLPVAFPALITQRRGVGLPNAGNWQVHVRSRNLFVPDPFDAIVTMRLADFMKVFTPRA